MMKKRTVVEGFSTLVRTVFFYVFGVFWTGLIAYITVVPFAIVERLLRIKSATVSNSILHYFVSWGSAPWRLVATVLIDDTARVDEGKAVIISNHHSYLDVFLLLHIFPRIHMTVRRSLLWIPFLGWAIALLQQIPHHHEHPRKALEKAAWWLENDTYVGIFPEGTRAPNGTILPFHRGAFRLAQKTTELIQPVVVVGTGRVWAKNRFWIHSLGPVAMRVLPPIKVPESAGRRELITIANEVHTMMLREHRRLEEELSLTT